MANRVPITQDKIKARKRKRLFWLTFGTLIIATLAVSGLSLISSLDALQIKHIEITGVSLSDNGPIEDLSKESLAGQTLYFFPHSDIFFFSASKLAHRIVDTFPSVASVSVSKKFFSTITVAVQEKTPSALWCLDAACDALDSYGRAFSEVSPFGTSSVPVFANGNIPHIGMSPLPSEEFVDLITFMKDLPQRGLYPTGAGLADDGEARVYVATSTYLLVDPSKDLSQSLANLDRILTNKTSGISLTNISSLQYIDLRFSNKIFYK